MNQIKVVIMSRVRQLKMMRRSRLRRIHPVAWRARLEGQGLEGWALQTPSIPEIKDNNVFISKHSKLMPIIQKLLKTFILANLPWKSTIMQIIDPISPQKLFRRRLSVCWHDQRILKVFILTISQFIHRYSDKIGVKDQKYTFLASNRFIIAQKCFPRLANVSPANPLFFFHSKNLAIKKPFY